MDLDKNVYVSKVFRGNKGTQHQMFQWVWSFPTQMFHYIQIFIKVKFKKFHMSLTVINDPFVNLHVNFFLLYQKWFNMELFSSPMRYIS
jgi:hypothetical protein